MSAFTSIFIITIFVFIFPGSLLQFAYGCQGDVLSFSTKLGLRVYTVDTHLKGSENNVYLIIFLHIRLSIHAHINGTYKKKSISFCWTCIRDYEPRYISYYQLFILVYFDPTFFSPIRKWLRWFRPSM